jgi:hypothetical protein
LSFHPCSIRVSSVAMVNDPWRWRDLFRAGRRIME